MKRKECFGILAGLTLMTYFTGIAPAQSVSVTPEFDHASARAGQASTYARSIDPASGMTADDLVRLALDRNGELAAARATIAEARGRLRQAGLKPNPMLETSGTKAVTGPDNNLMVGFELPLELGGRRASRVRVAQRELEVREAEVRDFERRLASEVRMKYAEAIAAARNLRFAEEQLRVDRDSLQLVQARVDLGKSAPLERSQVWVELNRADAARINFESKVEQALLELKKVVGMPAEENLQLRGAFTSDKQPPPQSEALRRALESRPDLAALRAAENLAEAQAEQARREGKVDASIFANYERMNFGFDVRGFNESGRLVPVTGIFHYATFGVRLTLPVRNKNQGLIEAALASVEAARRRREFAEQVARNEVAAAYARYERAQSALNVYRDRVREPALQNLDLVHKTYTLGYKTALDHLAEQRRFTEIETGYTDMLKENFTALAEIERVTGTTASPVVTDNR